MEENEIDKLKDMIIDRDMDIADLQAQVRGLRSELHTLQEAHAWALNDLKQKEKK